VDAGEQGQQPQRKQIVLKVEPNKAEEITQNILAGMEEARGGAVNDTAGTNGNGSLM